MKTLTAREILRRAFKGQKSVVTPRVLKVGKLAPHLAYEISQEVEPYIYAAEPMVSVTVVNGRVFRRNRDMSQTFYGSAALEDATQYVDDLKVWHRVHKGETFELPFAYYGEQSQPELECLIHCPVIETFGEIEIQGMRGVYRVPHEVYTTMIDTAYVTLMMTRTGWRASYSKDGNAGNTQDTYPTRYRAYREIYDFLTE